MASPLFSIITVTLNCADEAVKTARSVFSQDFQDFEFIIKDGLSVDNTVERLYQIGARNIKVSSDSGIYDAMNQALAMCSGKYTYFLNAGDTFYSNHVLKELSNQIEPRSAIVYGNLNLYPLGKISRPPARLSRYYLFRKNLNHQAWMARTDIYNALNGFNLSYRYAADQEFLWRVILTKDLPVQYIDIIFATFVYGGASTSKSARPYVRKERCRLLHNFYSYWEFALYGTIGLYFLNPFKAYIWNKLYSSRLQNI